MILNPKGLENGYLSKHLMGKGISLDLIRSALSEGREVTEEINHRKEGSRYFALELPDGAGLPGRFILPEVDGPLGSEVCNWNASCRFVIRHGIVGRPVLRRDELPEWLIRYASVVYVIIERNELTNGRLQVEDGPTEADPEGSWLVATAHFGPPSRQRPRVPRDCSDPKKIQQYLEDLNAYEREQSRVIFVDLEADGHVGPAPASDDPSDELGDLRRAMASMATQLDSLRKEMKKAGRR